MKKGLIYYCLLLSVALHLLLVLFIRLEQVEKKEKEPIAIDLVGPSMLGPKTALPQQPQKQETKPLAAKPAEQAPKIASVRPSLPFFPTPASPQQEPRGQALPSPPTVPAPLAVPGEKATPPSAPGSKRRQGSPASPPSFARPTQEDLMRYANVEKDIAKSKEGEITLDRDDMEYTSYLHSFKKRVETIWRYPETARRDGIEGNLVMRFSIIKSGKVEDIDILKSSGYPMLDDAAKQALLDASPFNPLPGNWKKDRFTITGTFMYRLVHSNLDME